MGNAYKDAGVDVERGYRAVELMRSHVQSTHHEGVLGGIGGFGGMISLKAIKDMDEPVMVAGTDGVGTKLKLAFLLDKHDTVGIDAVAMCVNDIVCQGAAPLYFLDYIATGRLEPEKVADIVKGIAEGCRQSGAALIGGETAEMPDFYTEGEYDIAGFAAGVVDRKNIIEGSRIQDGDVLVGLESSGVHSNGFSLVRKLAIKDDYRLGQYTDELGMTVGETLLTPTRIYVKPILKAAKNVEIKGLSHITGGGFIENIPRMLPEGLQAHIAKSNWEVPPIFRMLQAWGQIGERDMFNTYNMGIGMVAAVVESEVGAFQTSMRESDVTSHVIGRVESGKEGIVFD
jgi:phosphoribosylformylglycinamidine cyclo-ligase